MKATQDRAGAKTSPEFRMLCALWCKLIEIEAEMKTPLVARRLHIRYCAICGIRVTNLNCGGYSGKSALTGQVYCEPCVDELEEAQS
jgi:hypothetical protein